MDHPLLNTFSNVEYLGCFKFTIIINNAVKNISEKSVFVSKNISLELLLRSRIIGSKGVITFKILAYYLCVVLKNTNDSLKVYVMKINLKAV